MALTHAATRNGTRRKNRSRWRAGGMFLLVTPAGSITGFAFLQGVLDTSALDSSQWLSALVPGAFAATGALSLLWADGASLGGPLHLRPAAAYVIIRKQAAARRS